MIGVIPTAQTVTGWPHGNCVKASYSALLELPLDEVPDFDPGYAESIGKKQGTLEREWLASIGYGLVVISTDPDNQLSDEVLGSLPHVPHLMSGISERGYGHRCVGIGGQLVWDPHPSQAGLVTVYMVGFVVPL